MPLTDISSTIIHQPHAVRNGIAIVRSRIEYIIGNSIEFSTQWTGLIQPPCHHTIKFICKANNDEHDQGNDLGQGLMDQIYNLEMNMGKDNSYINVSMIKRKK